MVSKISEKNYYISKEKGEEETLVLERIQKTHLCTLYGLETSTPQIETALLPFRNFLKAIKI